MYEKFLEEVEEFIFMENQPEQADIIFVPGNSYPASRSFCSIWIALLIC